ncbi:MAG TPA: hypothetical protein PLJ44_09595 [Victivallales bacterium]|nr:hypothetical protein [Victivallales bacterium]
MKWSKEEIEALKKLYPAFIKGLISKNELAEVFPYRTIEAIVSKAQKMGLSKIEGEIEKEKYRNIIKRIKI